MESTDITGFFDSAYTDEYNELQVHCKNFDVRCFFLDGQDESFENGINIFLGEFLKNKDNKVKIVAPLAPIPNIYSLCVLTTLSRLLSELKSREQDNFKDILKQLEFDVLLMQIVRIDYLVDPFIRHTKQIMDFTNKLKLGINIVLPFTQSFLNTMIKNIKILNAKMASECLKNIKYLKIDNKDINKLPDDWRTKLDEIKRETNLCERSKKVILEGGMVYDLLGVFKGKYLEDIKKNDLKVILILPEPTKMIIDEMKDLISTDTNNNTMILYYTDPVHQNDPPKILRNIASYVTILSPYYHISELESYGMDEYYNIAMLTQFKNRMFDIPSELENLISTAFEFYHEDKNTDIERLKKTLDRGDMEEMHKTFEKIEKDYIEKAKKISKIENDSILSVQDTALDQLKLIL